MTNEAVLPEPAMAVARIVVDLMDEVRPQLVRAALSGDRGESENQRHTDNFLSVHDLRMHRRYRELLADVIPSFVYASEEAEPQVIGPDADPELCVLVDPLDTSELAVRALHGYTHVMVYSRTLGRPVVSVVGDIFHHLRLYIAARDEAGVDRAYIVSADGDVAALRGAPSRTMKEALVTNYSMRPAERFVPLSDQTRLLQQVGRIGVDFGSVGLCHVAAGFTDAMVEFAKGFAIWDLAPGHYVLHAAGGVLLDMRGEAISLDYGLRSIGDIAAAMNGRRRFVAARDLGFAREILACIDGA